VMTFNMECGDPFKDGLNDEQLHTFVPKDCDVYAVGLQEAGGEIQQVMPSPTAPPGTAPEGQESLYNMLEMFLLANRSCKRLRHTDTPSGAGVMEDPAVAGRGDQSMKKPKFTSIALYVRQELLPHVQLQASCACSFGVTEGSKGAVAMVLRCFGTTVAFVNCHLTANKGRTGKSEKQFGKNSQYSIVTRQLGRKLGRRAARPQRHASSSSLASPSLGSPLATHRGHNYFELGSIFHHVVWMGDMNYKLDKGIEPTEAIDMIRRGQLAELHAQYDTLTMELSRDADDEPRACYYNYREPAKVFSHEAAASAAAAAAPGGSGGGGGSGGAGSGAAAAAAGEMPIGVFYPTYKKKPRREKPNFSDENWVESEYRIMYKEPWYKGGNTKPRVPGWCDRILYYSLRDLDTLLTPVKAGGSGGAHRTSVTSASAADAGHEGGPVVDNYQAVNDVLRCSDHSPVHATFHLRTAGSSVPDGASNQIYQIRLFDVSICDETHDHVLSRHGGWQSLEEASAAQASSDEEDGRQVHVMVPAPFELAGKVYEGKRLQMAQLLEGKPGQVFSFCGFNQANVKPGTAHHMCVKFDICEASTSGSSQQYGECVVRLPLTDFVSSNTLHFRELLIAGGVPVTDERLFDGRHTKVYADFKIHLIGDQGFHHEMAACIQGASKAGGGLTDSSSGRGGTLVSSAAEPPTLSAPPILQSSAPPRRSSSAERQRLSYSSSHGSDSSDDEAAVANALVIGERRKDREVTDV
jgi:hypothetical protein